MSALRAVVAAVVGTLLLVGCPPAVLAQVAALVVEVTPYALLLAFGWVLVSVGQYRAGRR